MHLFCRSNPRAGRYGNRILRADHIRPYGPLYPDSYGLRFVATIGKGARSQAVCESIVRNQGVYFCSIGGAGALAAQCIKRCEVIAYNDLGCESIKKLTVSDFPLIVAVDCMGADLFVLGRAQYAQMQAV